MNQKGNADDNDNNKGNDYVMKVWCLWTESDKKYLSNLSIKS